MDIRKLSEDFLEGKVDLEDYVTIKPEQGYHKNPIMTLERLFDAEVRYLSNHDVYEITLRRNFNTRFLSYINWSAVASKKYSNDAQLMTDILLKLKWGIQAAIDA